MKQGTKKNILFIKSTYDAFFLNTFKGNIAQVPAVIDDKFLKPFTEVVHGLRVIAGGMAATSCRIASFNC